MYNPKRPSVADDMARMKPARVVGAKLVRGHMVRPSDLAAKAEKVQHTARSYGLVRLLGGSTIVLVASMLVLTGWFVFPLGLGRRMVAVGLLLGAAGAWPLLLGAYSLLTGRDARA